MMKIVIPKFIVRLCKVLHMMWTSLSKFIIKLTHYMLPFYKLSRKETILMDIIIHKRNHHAKISSFQTTCVNHAMEGETLHVY